MSKTSKKSSLHPDKQKLEIKPELIITQTILAPNLQAFKQKHLSGCGFLVFKLT